MDIHSLCILRKSGVPIYYRNFSDGLKDLDFNLISSFLTAILEFSKKVVKKDLNVLEMGNLRFFFQNYKKKGFSEIFFILITDINASVLLIKERLRLISNSFFSTIDPHEYEEKNCIIEREDLDNLMDSLINLRDDYSTVTIDPLEKIFETEISEGDIIAGAIISLQGQIYYSSLPNEDLHTALRELEIRYQAETQTEAEKMPKLIYQSQDKMIFSQIVLIQALHKDPVNIVLLFSAGTTLGMADFNLEEIIKKLSNVSLKK